MAENSSEKGLMQKVKLTKRIKRADEIIRQKVLKKDKTTDSDFDRLVEAFSQQQSTASHLVKELKNYTAKLEAMSVASRSMYQTVNESYESTSRQPEKLALATEDLVGLWDGYMTKLNDNVHSPITDYINKFKDVKTKISKRDRKLTDYDCARHNLESVKNAKKRDESKVAKAQEELNSAKAIYDVIHNELCEELPALYESRVPILCSCLATLFDVEAAFQADCARAKRNLAELVRSEAGLETSGPHSAGPHTVRLNSSRQESVSHVLASSSMKVTPPRPPVAFRPSIDKTPEPKSPRIVSEGYEGDEHLYISVISDAPHVDPDSSDEEGRNVVVTHRLTSNSSVDGAAKRDSASYNAVKTASDEGFVALLQKRGSSSSNDSLTSPADNTLHMSSIGSLNPEEIVGVRPISAEIKVDTKHLEVVDHGTANGTSKITQEKVVEKLEIRAEGEAKRSEGAKAELSSSSDEEEEKESKAAAAAKSPKANNFLYQVVAIHDYAAVDADELSFEKGEVIGVLPYDNSSDDEQDDGWLFGIKSSTGEKGVFPQNFTSKF